MPRPDRQLRSSKQQSRLMIADPAVPSESGRNHVSLACEDNLEFMEKLQDGLIKLVVTSPPYNLGKNYEVRTSLGDYLEAQERVVSECVRVLDPQGVYLLADRELCRQRGDCPA